MTQRRLDRYSNPQNACLVYGYMESHLDEVLRLFRVPGFHKEKFRTEFALLAKLSKCQLHNELHMLCQQYDKSDQPRFSKFKTKMRRYLFNLKGNRQLTVSNQNMERLQRMVLEERLSSIDEAIEQLMFAWGRLNKQPVPGTKTPFHEVDFGTQCLKDF